MERKKDNNYANEFLLDYRGIHRIPEIRPIIIEHTELVYMCIHAPSRRQYVIF